jgi:hypothetical protein
MAAPLELLGTGPVVPGLQGAGITEEASDSIMMFREGIEHYQVYPDRYIDT